MAFYTIFNGERDMVTMNNRNNFIYISCTRRCRKHERKNTCPNRFIFHIENVIVRVQYDFIKCC